MIKNKKTINYIVILLIVLVFLIILASSIGSADIGFKDAAKAIGSHIPGISRLIDQNSLDEQVLVIVTRIRLPRIFLSIFVGIALAAAGVIFQGIFRNPMADPYIIGVSAGASFGATLGLLVVTGIRVLNFSATSIFAFIGAIGVTFLVYNISKVSKQVSVVTLLLAGVALSALFSAINSFILMFRSHDLAKVVFWILGGLTAASWQQFILIAPIILVLVVIASFFMKDLNLISLGEERSTQLGVETEKVKKILMILASLIAAAAVSVSGIIGFVGLITPHIMRILVGPDHRKLLPASAIAGGIVLLFSDTVARTILEPREIPVGIITSILGVPFFLYLLIRAKRSIF